jgi:hypothetical protein
MEKPTTQNNTARIAGFVTAGELSQLNQLEKKLNVIDSHDKGLHRDLFENQVDLAQNKYLNSPSTESFENYKRLMIEHEILSKLPRISAIAELAMKRFVDSEVAAVLLPILDRGLSAARDNVAEITQQENKRLKGVKFSSSDAIEAAQAPLVEFEDMLRIVNNPSPHVEGLRNVFARLRRYAADHE